MAEQEVIKHTKVVYKIWNSKQHSFWHKLKEFLIEIFIIVFAVSLSIWFHNWSEHRHEQADVKKFLTGLREDFDNDIKEMRDDIQSYQMQSAVFTYITSLKLNEHLRKDSMQKYVDYLLNTTWLVPNSGRFEGFKSSGKMANIENDSLQNTIMDLYQEDIPSLLNSTNGYIETKKELFSYLRQHVRRITDSTDNSLAVLESEEARNICASMTYVGQIIERYNNCIHKMESMSRVIASTYHLQADEPSR